MNDTQKYSIGYVQKRTGLSVHVIRAWEHRYQAVTPLRGDNDHRVYSAADIERLQLLRMVTAAGRNIGQVARLSTDELKQMVQEDQQKDIYAPHSLSSAFLNVDELLGICMRQVESLDAAALEESLLRASIHLSRPDLINKLIVGLMQKIGESWRDGKFRIVHEHVSSAVIRTFLGTLSQESTTNESAPRIVVTTPSGQMHEFGALLAAATAAGEGWQVYYAGPNLPAEEIAAAVERVHARALAISIIYPSDDLSLFTELKKIRKLVPAEVAIIAGGRGAEYCRKILDDAGAIISRDFESLSQELEKIRSNNNISVKQDRD